MLRRRRSKYRLRWRRSNLPLRRDRKLSSMRELTFHRPSASCDEEIRVGMANSPDRRLGSSLNGKRLRCMTKVIDAS